MRHDFRRRHDLAGVACRVLGCVKQQADGRGRQSLPADLPRLQQGGLGRALHLIERCVEPGADSRDQRPGNGRVFGNRLRFESGQLIG